MAISVSSLLSTLGPTPMATTFTPSACFVRNQDTRYTSFFKWYVHAQKGQEGGGEVSFLSLIPTPLSSTPLSLAWLTPEVNRQ